MPRVSAEHKAEVRQRLLDAARHVVVRDGAEAATTRSILDEAGLSAGALYSYFSSKEELLRQLATQIVEDNATSHEAEAGDEAVDLARRFVVDALTTPQADPVVAFLRSRTTPDPDVQRAIAALNHWIVDRFTPVVEAAQREGALDDGIDAAAVVELLDMLFDAMNLRAAHGTFATSFERVGDIAMQLLASTVAEPVP